MQGLFGLDLAVTVAAAALWIGAAVVGLGLGDDSSRLRRGAVLALAAAGCGATLARVATVSVLQSAGWWFVEEKVMLALPLAIVAAAAALWIAGRELLRVTAGPLSVRSAVALLAGAYGATAAVAIQFLVGYPLTLAAAVVAVAVVGLAIVLTHLVLSSGTRRAIGGAAALLVLTLVASAGWAWMSDRAAWSQLQLPGAHHGQAVVGAEGGPVASVADLRTPQGDPDAQFALEARQQSVTLASGRVVDAWTFGSLPGPELRVTQGDLVEVTLTNRDVEVGVTLHWHGYDLPNGEDGVAGVTQNAVMPGESFTYRFVANDTGTYWYHSHQASAEAVVKGLYGTIIVEPASNTADVDVAVPLHSIGGAVLMGGSDEPQHLDAAPGDVVRLRLINTDQQTQRFALAGAAFTVVSMDGRDIEGGTEIVDRVLRLPAGGRVDVRFVMPDTGVTLAAEASDRATLTAGQPAEGASFDSPEFDPIRYGTGGLPDLGSPTVRETLVLDRQLRVLGGAPSLAYTVNGAVFPNIAPTTVREGDVAIFTVVNRGSESHPMHPHGHHVLVLSRNGQQPTTALWLDTVDVQPGDVWVFALVADNPGIWMDHCHNLDHAAQGMMFSLSYESITTPFSHGGGHGNRPE